MKSSDLLVRALEAEGVEQIFGVPGEENLDILESLRCSSIRLVVTRHEQAAGFMAATYGRLTGRAGVCLATLGPGATNLVTAAAYAQLGAMPMLMITGQKPIKMSKQGEFQILDIVDMMRPLTKYTRQLSSAANIPARVREAIRRAEDERPGAVHLELPEDIAREQTEAPLVPRSRFDIPHSSEASVRQARDMIQAARHPLLLVGAGASRRHACKALRAFVDKTGIPFFTTQMGKGLIDERHPLYLGTAALSGEDYLHRAIEHADLIVNVGHDVVEKPPFIMDTCPTDSSEENRDLDGACFAGSARVVHINYIGASIDSVYHPQQGLIGDITDSIERLTAAIDVPVSWDFSRFSAVQHHLHAHVREGTDDERFPVYPQRLVAEVRRVMPDDGILALDNGIYKIWFARNYPAYQPGTVLLDNALASMGAGLPSAIAAKMVYPERRVMAICGDGGFMMNSQEMETVVRLGLDLVIVVLRDDAYGMVKWKQTDMGFASFGLDYGNPDFVAYARSYGAEGHRPASAAALGPLLEACLEAPGVHLIDVPVDYRDNHRILHHEIKVRSRAI